jgi:putrescine transport system substrate-binding protein
MMVRARPRSRAWLWRRRMGRTARRCETAACLAVLLLAGSATAGEEPVVNVYNWADYMGPTTLADFESETGIEVNYDTYATSEIVEAKLLAGSTGYDVVLHGARSASRVIPIGVFMPLDRSRIPSWRDLDPRLLAILAEYDPGNLHGAPFMWGSTGFAYNVEMIRQRMPDAPVGSGDMIFDPEVVGRFADCGVTFLDSPTDVIPMALVYLGMDANSTDPVELSAAEALLRSVRPLIKYFSSTRMLVDMPNQEVCVAMSWSGDYAVARARAAEAGIDIDLAYSVPAEGSVSWFDAFFIPVDAPHPDNAHRFIDFLLRPEVIAAISNQTRYANPVKGARPLVDPAILEDPAIYPPPEVIERLQSTHNLAPKQERLRTRIWARFKAGL